MKTKRELERVARRLFQLCMVNGNLDEDRARLVFKHVLESRVRGYLLMLGRLKRLLKSEYARRSARIESAVALPVDLQSRIQSELTARYGPGLSWLYTEQPALIGGIRIQVGNDVYDGSIRAELTKLARTLGITGNGFGRQA